MFLPLSISRVTIAAIVCSTLLFAYLLPGEWVNRLSQNNSTLWVYSGICIYQSYVNELLTPQLSVNDFQAMMASKEEAQSKIEEVQFLDDLALGPVIAVNLKGDSKEHRLRLPKELIHPTYEKLRDYRIRTFVGWRCY